MAKIEITKEEADINAEVEALEKSEGIKFITNALNLIRNDEKKVGVIVRFVARLISC